MMTHYTPLHAMTGARLGMLRAIVSAAGPDLRTQAWREYRGRYSSPTYGRPDVAREVREYAIAHPEHCRIDFPMP